jgi:hypothetical protein
MGFGLGGLGDGDPISVTLDQTLLRSHVTLTTNFNSELRLELRGYGISCTHSSGEQNGTGRLRPLRLGGPTAIDIV